MVTAPREERKLRARIRTKRTGRAVARRRQVSHHNHAAVVLKPGGEFHASARRRSFNRTARRAREPRLQITKLVAFKPRLTWRALGAVQMLPDRILRAARRKGSVRCLIRTS